MIHNKKASYFVTFYVKNKESGRSGHGWTSIVLDHPFIETGEDLLEIDRKVNEVAIKEEGPGTISAITNIIRLPI